MHRIRACVATLTADSDLCSELSNLSVSAIQDLSLATPDSSAVTSLYDYYTTVTESSAASGNYYYYDSTLITFSDLSDTEKLQILCDGLCNDMLLRAMSDLGMPVNKPQPIGYFPAKVFLYLFTYYAYYIIVYVISRGSCSKAGGSVIIW